MNNIHELLVHLNKNEFDVSFEFLDNELNEVPHSDYDPHRDVVLYYDGTDEDFDAVKTNAMREWLYNEAWPSINACMKANGFYEADIQDGSGNGLYYGSVQYKQVG